MMNLSICKFVLFCKVLPIILWHMPQSEQLPKFYFIKGCLAWRLIILKQIIVISPCWYAFPPRFGIWTQITLKKSPPSLLQTALSFTYNFDPKLSGHLCYCVNVWKYNYQQLQTTGNCPLVWNFYFFLHTAKNILFYSTLILDKILQ